MTPARALALILAACLTAWGAVIGAGWLVWRAAIALIGA